jgi:hypothetical protein
MNARTLKIAAIAATLLGATAAQAASNNPLAPAYYWDKVTVTDGAAGNGAAGGAYVANSPLHPAYFQAKAAGESFVGTATDIARPERNPLHPRFQRG